MYRKIGIVGGVVALAACAAIIGLRGQEETEPVTAPTPPAEVESHPSFGLRVRGVDDARVQDALRVELARRVAPHPIEMLASDREEFGDLGTIDARATLAHRGEGIQRRPYRLDLDISWLTHRGRTTWDGKHFHSSDSGSVRHMVTEILDRLERENGDFRHDAD